MYNQNESANNGNEDVTPYYPRFTAVEPQNQIQFGEAPVMLELWGMLSTSLLPSLPGSLWSGVVPLDSILSTGQIKLLAFK